MKNNILFYKKKLVIFPIISILAIALLSMPSAIAADFPHDYAVEAHVEIINGAIIQNYNPAEASGTGVFDPFLRLKGGGPSYYYGYNSDGKGSDLEFYEDHAWTKSYLLTNVPLVLKDPDGEGGDPAQYYREFQLDMNQVGGSYLTLDELEVYWSDMSMRIIYGCMDMQMILMVKLLKPGSLIMFLVTIIGLS